MNSLRQSIHSSVFAESKNFHFSQDVPAGDLLLAYVTSSDVILEDDYWAFLGYVHDAGLPNVTISTPGIEWVLLGTCEATADPYLTILHYESAVMRIQVYAAFNVPALATSVATTITSDNSPTNGSGSVGISLLDFSTTQVVTGVSESRSIAQDGSDIGPSNLGDVSWTTTEPSYQLTAGIIATNPGDLVVVLTTAAITYIIYPGDYSGYGFTQGTSVLNQYMLNSPGGGINTRFSLALVQAFVALAFTFGTGGTGGGGGGGGEDGGGGGGTPPTRFLSVVPGFSDLPDLELSAEDRAAALARLKR